MNVSSGAAQDPLNYLQRRITENTRYSKRLKRHLAIAIRKAKRARRYTDEEAIAVASRISSYGRRLYLEEVLDGLDATDKSYRYLIMSLCKMSEDSKRNLAAVKDAGRSRSNGKRVPTARTSQPQSADHEGESEESDDGAEA